MPPSPPPDALAERLKFLHQETVKLIVLVIVAVAGFFVTRALARNNRAVNLADAAEWDQRGQAALAAHLPFEAVDAFRHAVTKDRSNRHYARALAGALADTNQHEAARRVLLTLRESAPEDPEVNLLLAHLSVSDHAVPDAVHYYQSALYAPWPAGMATSRQVIREELIRLLLARDDVGRAVAEIAALGAELPDDAAAHITVGDWYAAAGDHAHAFDQFERALRLAPGNGAARAGAGLAAFNQKRYAAADQYLREASDAIAGVRDTRHLVALIVSSDPLAARIGASARRQRLSAILARGTARISACPASSPDRTRLLDDAHSFEMRLTPPRGIENDLLESGLDLVYRMERAAGDCSPGTELDRALLLLAEARGARL